MTRVPAKVISGGRVTLPKEIRQSENIDVGDYVVVNVRPMEESDD